MKTRVRNALVAVAAGIVLIAVLPAIAAAPPKDIVDTAVAAGSFTSLVAAVQAADLVQVLKGPGPFTLFAPNDAAFAKIPKTDLDALLKDKAKLTKVLTHHVFAGNANSKDLAMLKDLSVADGGRLTIQVVNGKMKIGGANVIQADITVANGTIHVIDAVLMPN
jgi:uncharacterized surface protein with fasciclin (FAS1) repeats